jgi:hypothetical protein
LEKDILVRGKPDWENTNLARQESSRYPQDMENDLSHEHDLQDSAELDNLSVKHLSSAQDGFVDILMREFGKIYSSEEHPGV